MTNHILNISLDMDTERIQKIVEDQAARQIIQDIRGEVEKTLFEHRWGYETDSGQRTGLRDFLVQRFNEFLTENKEDIIEAAAKQLCEKLYRSKAFTERVDGIVKEAKS